jgi:hypothetical protein
LRPHDFDFVPSKPRIAYCRQRLAGARIFYASAPPHAVRLIAGAAESSRIESAYICGIRDFI